MRDCLRALAEPPEPDSNDDACDTCSKSSCCAEFKALVGDARFFDYVDLLNACTDSACADCQAQYPNVPQVIQNYIMCQRSNCAAPCGL